MMYAAKRVAVVVMLLGVIVSTSGCGPEAAAAWSQIAHELVGGVLALGAIILILIGSIPPM